MSESSTSCLSETDLDLILHEVCTPDQQTRFRRHLDSCQVCQHRLEDLAGAIPGMDTNGPREVPPALSSLIAELGNLDPTTRHSRPSAETLSDGQRAAFSFLAPSPARPDLLGRLGKYEVTRFIGQGGMGVVFAATDPLLEREVAIKVPSAAAVAEPTARARFVREARAIAAVQHRHIVTVFVAEEVAGTLILVMELVHGKSLAERLRTESKMSWKDAAAMGQQVAAAVAAAHEVGIVHRDITPANVLIEHESGLVKVTDFGLARTVSDVSLTHSGTLAGTPEYMSPEQAAEKKVDARSDLFSLGTLLYQASTGVSPFRAPTLLGTLRKICEESPQSLDEVDPTIPGWYCDLVAQLLAKDPRERPSARECERVLRQAGQGERPAVARRTVGRQSEGRLARRPIVAALVACLVMLLGTIVLIASRESRHFLVRSAGTSFGDLQAALDAAGDGDVVDVFGDGPFSIHGVSLKSKRLTLRAASGSLPVFVNAPGGNGEPFLSTGADLELDGIEVHWPTAIGVHDAHRQLAHHCAVWVAGANVTLRNCRLVAEGPGGCLGCQSGSVAATGSHFVAAEGPGIVWHPSDDAQLVAAHCVFEGDRSAVVVHGSAASRRAAAARAALVNNSFASRVVVQVWMEMPMRTIDFTSRRNASDAATLLTLTPGTSAPRANFAASMQKRLIFAKLSWIESQNAYRRGIHFIERGHPDHREPELVLEPTLAGWLALVDDSDGKSWEVDFLSRGPQQDRDAVPRDVFANVRAVAGSPPWPVGADIARVGPQRRSSRP